MLRRLALSYWTPIATGLALLGLHLAWAIWWEPTKRGEITTGFGACLIVLGLLVAARPYLRSGLGGASRAAVPGATLAPYLDAGGQILRETDAATQRGREAAAPDITAERVVAVWIIIAGTMLNGYGPVLVRLVGLEVQPS